MLTLTLTGIADRQHSEALLEVLQTNVSKGHCAVLLDTRAVTLAEPLTARDNLRREAQWLAKHQDLVASQVAAFALVFDNVAMRFLFSGLLSLAPLRVPWKTCTDAAEGRRFCLDALRTRSTPASSAGGPHRGRSPR